MTYDYELCVLFLYHRCDDLTKSHLQSLRDSNPAALVLPLTDSVTELLPGSIDVAMLPDFCAEAEKWRGIDATLYRWFRNRSFDARRYLLAEYDCRCDVNLQDYYAGVWDADVAGVDFFTRKANPRWRWFLTDSLQTIPASDYGYAAGIVPFTCTLFSHRALEKIVSAVYTHDVFSELRLGTIVNKLGLRFERLPFPERSTICWHEYPWQTSRPGFFHGIKSLDHNRGRRSQPGYLAARVYDLFRSLTHNRVFPPYFLKRRLSRLRT